MEKINEGRIGLLLKALAVRAEAARGEVQGGALSALRKLLRAPGLIVLILVCYVAFSISAVVAIVACPVALLFDIAYASSVLRAMDRLMAAVVGFDGRNTLSAECGADMECRACAALCKVLALLDPGPPPHCERYRKE